MPSNLFVLIPTYFDGKATTEIIFEIIDLEKINEKRYNLQFFVIDDSGGMDHDLLSLNKIKNTKIIKTSVSKGNQNAIIYGLGQILKTKKKNAAVVVMDGDGEDNPADVFKLLSEIESDANLELIHAVRGKRNIGIQFRILITIFRVIFRILTGRDWRTGNFCAIQVLWIEKNYNEIVSLNNFAGSILALPAKRKFIKLNRPIRRYEISKTSNEGKILYALNSLMPWVDKILIRSLIFFGFSILNLITSISISAYIKFVMDSATPNWFTILFVSAIALCVMSLSIFLTAYLLKSLSYISVTITGKFR
jgi:hypothetical protein